MRPPSLRRQAAGTSIRTPSSWARWGLTIAVLEFVVLFLLGLAIHLRLRAVLAVDTTIAAWGVSSTRHAHGGSAWWTAVADWGQPNVLRTVLVLAAIALLCRRRARLAVWILITVVLETLVAPASKPILDRPRPQWSHPLTLEAGSSFPSGHAAAAGMLVTVVILLMFPWTGRSLTARVTVVSLATLCASLICLSRIFLGVHYLTDVLGGAILGSALCLVAYLVVGRPVSAPPGHKTPDV